MNKRIKLLADQAEDYATAEYEKWIPTPDFSGIPHIRKIFNEKFAELIVQECIAQVEQAKNSPFVSLDDAKRMAHFVDVTKKKIGKHFGLGL